MNSPKGSRPGFTALLLVLLGLFAAGSARANLGSYVFAESTGERIDISGISTAVFTGNDGCVGTNIDDNSNSAVDIGFNFRFAGNDYAKFSASTNGLIGLFTQYGSTKVSSCWVNLLNAVTGGCSDEYALTLDSIPQIAPMWDDMRVASTCSGHPFDGMIHYAVVGEAPSRVLVIEFRDMEYDYRQNRFTTFQTRLYEGSNRIEFWYAGTSDLSFSGDGSSIGLAAIDGASVLSVSAGPPASASTGSVDDRNDPRNIAANTLYTFVPCEIRIGPAPSGEVSAVIVDGQDLLDGAEVTVGSEATFEPIMLSLGESPCDSRSYTFELGGIGASEYTISPQEGSLEPGSSTIPMITYRPMCPGTRPATLRIVGSDGTDRTFLLGAVAMAQIEWRTDIAQGGTPALADGDTLLGTVVVMRNQATAFTPLTIANINPDPSAPATDVSFELIDPNGQYTISTTGATLGVGESVTPSITFLATAITFQEAYLVVTTACEQRTFLLRAFSAAPAGALISNGETLGPDSYVFGPNASCVASGSEVVPIIVQNTGYGDFLITGVDIYRTDTMQRQGTPPFPMLRDAAGALIRSSEYRLANAAGIALTLPIVVAQGSSRMIYVHFIGSEPGRRYARAYVRTNGQNFANPDALGEVIEGVLSFNLLARSIGSGLAATPDGARIRPLVMTPARLGESSTARFPVSNAGACDLLIRRDKLRITSGDVHEFELVDVLPATPVDAKANTYRIAPGATDYITVRFTPSRSGTRIATVTLQTNDSTIWLPGLSERGTYRVDLYGFGRAGLDASSLVLPPVLVGGVVDGTAILENSSNGVVDVRQISFVGDDAAEFRASATKPWPTLPAAVLPGGKLALGVELAPTGLAGARRTVLEVITTTEDTIRVAVRGEAGIAELEVGPTVLFEDVNIPIGQYVRRTVTITNNGTFPVRLQTPFISGVDAANYTIGALPRRDIDAGQSEFLEVTFRPEQEGTSSATLEIPSSLGTRTVQLGGGSLVTIDRETTPDDGVSGFDVATTGGLRVDAIRPNPTAGAAEVTVWTARAADVVVTVHDGLGRLVAEMARGRYDAGRHTIRFDTGTLAGGVYHVRVSADGASRSMTLTVVR